MELPIIDHLYSIETTNINDLKISNEEKELTITRMKNLMKIDRERLINSANIARLFEEWKVVAQRIQRGGKMLDEAKYDPNDEYFKSLYDLYYLQHNLLGLYDMFFKKNLKEAQYERAFNDIYQNIAS